MRYKSKTISRSIKTAVCPKCNQVGYWIARWRDQMTGIRFEGVIVMHKGKKSCWLGKGESHQPKEVNR